MRTCSYLPFHIGLLKGTLLIIVFGILITACNKNDYRPEEVLNGNKYNSLRIISLSCSMTDNLYKMGAADQVIGITSVCEEKIGINDKPLVGGRGLNDINIERIIELNPDLIISWRSRAAEELRRRGFNVLITTPQTVEEIIETIKRLGEITGRLEEARIITNDMEKRLHDVKQKVSSAKTKPSVYIEYWRPYWTRSRGTLPDEMIRIAGGRNIAGDLSVPYPTLNSEFVIKKNPDIIIMDLRHNSTGNNMKFDHRPGWSGISAVRKGKVFIQKPWYTHHSYRCIDGLEMYARWIHPEVYNKNR